MTRDEVQEAVATLEASGQPLTYANIRERIGRGSRRDISRHLKALGAQQAVPPPAAAPEATVPPPQAVCETEPLGHVPEGSPAPPRQSIVEAAQTRRAKLYDRQATLEAQLMAANQTLIQRRRALAQALAAGHDGPLTMLNEQVAAIRAEIARLEALAAELPAALVLAEATLKSAQKRQAQHERQHWAQLRTTLATPAEQWVCELLSGQLTLWPGSHRDKPRPGVRMAIAKDLKAHHGPPPLYEEGEEG